MSTPFHLAFPVHDLAQARSFYGEVIGCTEGRSTKKWVDFDFFGHQISAHLVAPDPQPVVTNPVDGDAVPVRHFGAILDREQWDALAERLAGAGVEFLIPPRIRFVGEPGEQGTFFVRDPAGNALEFKTFADRSRTFAR